MRLAKGGLIDRTKALTLRVDGLNIAAHPGDTLASALVANGVRLVGRSFKYHRPRGIVTAGSDEPNALFEIGTGADRLPNTRATVQEVYDGLVATSQNRWPSLRLDVLAVNDLMSRFLGAGFYYKTFMWPARLWERLYEPLIRRAAGLGRLSGEPDPAVYDKAFAHCDLLVIGAGPSGLVAALTAARAGARVILCDEDFVAGGRLLAETGTIDDMPGATWAAQALAELHASPNVRVMLRTTVTGAYDGGTYGALQRVADHLADARGAPRQTFWRIAARRAILAGGALERPIAFAMNDRPGVMLAGAVRAYVNRHAAAPGQRVTVFTNNDDGWRTACDLLAAGVQVAALIDSRADAAPQGLDCEVISGAQVTDTRGRLGLRQITVTRADGSTRQIETDCLAVSGGWNPSVHLTCHMGARPAWREDIAAFVPAEGAIPGLDVAGAARGDLSMHSALAGGAGAARAALADMGLATPDAPLPQAEDAPVAITPLWHVPGRGRAWLDFQNDVTVKDVVQAHLEGYRSVEHLKRYTTLGMATDQGKLSNMGGLAVMAELTGQSIAQTGTTVFRPPYTPVQMGALGARATGTGLAPERRIPTDRWSRERGAHWLEAGLWYRPAWFPQGSETHWRQSCDREVLAVRNAVGICDVSTLGKIDIQGPDAALLLDRVYSNTFSTLKVGRVRYGLMLREDGIVMDDGTCARLGETHFLMTTTTAAAGQVMAHLEFCTQCLWPDLDVQFASVTDHWAQIAIAGPRSREVLCAVLDQPIDNDSFPYMACGGVSVSGVAGRLFRISFSGEHAYELAVPAGYGESLMVQLVELAEGMGGCAYGLEALNVLRIEKGHITHAEIDGRVTADDIGMGAMVAQGKDCIGKAMSRRPGLHGPQRRQMVGLRPVGTVRQILGGSNIYAAQGPQDREGVLGNTTSVCFSPVLEQMIGLGFVINGRARLGETVRVVDHLRDRVTLCEIVSPHFLDPQGERLRG